MPIGPFPVWAETQMLTNKMADSFAMPALEKILFIRRSTDGQMFCEQIAQDKGRERQTAPAKCRATILWYSARFLVMI
jgi:hypothetical protein